MVTKIVGKPLGMGVFDYSPSKKYWIPVAFAAASLASSIYGGVKASQQANKAEGRQRQQEAEENAWYNRRYYEDYVDTAAGQNLIRRAKDYAREQWKRAAGAQAVTGGTEAASAAAKEAGNKMVGDTIANIASNDQARKDHVDSMHRQAQKEYAQMDMQRDMQRAQNITQAAQGASNAMMSAAGALGGGSLKGGSNNSSGFSASEEIQGGQPVSKMEATLPKQETPVFDNQADYDRWLKMEATAGG